MLIPLDSRKPQIADNVFIAPTAVLIGDVHVEQGASVWFGAVIRADFGTIVVGVGSTVQDNAVVHVSEEHPTLIGQNVVVGHGAILEGCRIGDRSVVGMNAIVLGGSEIGQEVMIAAGSVVTEGMRFPPRVLVAGSPARVKKELSGSALAWITRGTSDYHRLRDRYLQQAVDRLKTVK